MKPCFSTLLGLICISLASFAQTTGSLLVFSNTKAAIFLDGKKVGEVVEFGQLQFPATTGDHLVKAVSLLDTSSVQSKEVFNMQPGLQKVLRFDLKKTSIEPIVVADMKFVCPGLETIIEYREQNPGKQFADQPVFYYAFEKGDTVLLDLDLSNGVYSCSFFVSKYPENTRVVGSIFLSKWDNFAFVAKEKSVYKFLIISDNYYDGVANLKIRRKPSNKEKSDFNTTVATQKQYKTVEIVNLVTSVKRSKKLMPIGLPPNTISFYYRYSSPASKGISLQSQLISLCEGLPLNGGDSIPAVPISKIKSGITGSFSPVVLDQENAILFEKQKKNETSIYKKISPLAEEAGAGIFKAANATTYWIGFENNTNEKQEMKLEVVAVTVEDGYIVSKEPVAQSTKEMPLVLRRKEFKKNVVSGGNVKSNVGLLPVEYQNGFIY